MERIARSFRLVGQSYRLLMQDKELMALPLLSGIFSILVAATFFVNDYTADLFRKLLLTTTLVLSFNFLFGIAGQLAFSHVAFYGIGAYAIVIFAHQLGWPLPLAFAAAIAVGFLLLERTGTGATCSSRIS